MSAAVDLSPALADLFSRAGASDTDRPAWLAERRGGVTATQIRDLVAKGPSFRRELLEIKLGRREETFVGSAYTEWGNLREPVIAAELQRRFNIAPESRVFHAQDDSRFLVSPDGVGVDWEDTLMVSEIKTSGHDVAPWSPKFDAFGYGDQMQWSMFVTGARKCLYAWEERLGSPGSFSAGELRTEWVHFDAVRAAELQRVALEFLAELDAAREDDADPAIDDALDVLAVNYLRFLDMENEGKTAKEGVWAQMKALLADVPTLSQESALVRVTWTRGGSVTSEKTDEVQTVDKEALRAAHPEVAAEYDAANAAVAGAAHGWAAAQEAWDALADEYTTTEKVTETVTTTKRDNLRVTAVRAPKADAA